MKFTEDEIYSVLLLVVVLFCLGLVVHDCRNLTPIELCAESCGARRMKAWTSQGCLCSPDGE